MVTAGAISGDGRTLTITNQAGWLSAFDMRSGRLKLRRRVLDEGDTPVNVQLSSDGNRYMTTEVRGGDTVPCQRTAVLSARSGRVLSELWLRSARSGLMTAFSGGAFSPDGRVAATFFPATQEWFFFDARNGRRLWKMGGPSPLHEGALKWCFSADGRRVGVCGPNGCEVRAARTGRVLRRSAQPKVAAAMAWSSDGKLLYSVRPGDAFEGDSVLWQWRIFGTARQQHRDKLVMARLRRDKERFALSPRHINESLIQAARQGNPTRVTFLLDRGANIEWRDREGATPLAIAAFGMDSYGGPKKFATVVQLLLKRGANVKTRTRQRDTPLTSAALGSATITKMLLEHGADVNARLFDGNTALSQAAGNLDPQPSIVRLLLQHGANANARDEQGGTPLMAVAGYSIAQEPSPRDVQKLVAIIKLLFAHGANVNARDKNGRTALRRASIPAVVRALREAGAKP